LAAGIYYYYWNVLIGSFSQGVHTIKVVADADNQVAESDETDNEYSRTITVQHLSGAPQITSISPSTASAGTTSSVTIAGSGFGVVQGTGKVEFFFKSNQPKIPADIVSWSDNQIVCTVPIGNVLMSDGNTYAGSAGTGPVTVTTVGGTSNGYSFTVTFGYGGTKWTGASPVVPFKVNENTPNMTGEGAEVQSAAASWSSAGANFSLLYDGATSVTIASANGINEISWGVTNGSLATAYYWYNGF
jgi:hypothetical protein